jgi:hypothetical protein
VLVVEASVAGVVAAAGVAAGAPAVVVGGRALVLLHAARRRSAASAVRDAVGVVMAIYTFERVGALQRVLSALNPL